VHPGGQRHAEGARDTERRRAPDRQRLDRGDQLRHRVQAQHSYFLGEHRLIDDLDGPVHPVDRPHGPSVTALVLANANS